jgi:crotonobetainyl-CoA:carnitine CoA-transferase CaiB-like acyl-CoA transferase
LSGVRVLDFGIVLAAPHCARLMADMGAEVIHVERAGTGDGSRHDPYLYEPGLSASFFLQNWGKKSLSINLQHPDGKRIIERLVEKSDVLIENFRPGVMAKLGFGYERLAQLNPRLVMCSISAYGQTGPYAQRPGYGALAEAVAAIPELTGEPTGPPMPTLFPIADNIAAALALGTICAALYAQKSTGRGRYLDMSLLDAAFQGHDIAVQRYLASQGQIRKTRRGLRDETWVPWGYFEGRDGWVVIKSVETEAGWATLVRAMGRDDLVGDPRYDSFEHRAQHKDELYDIMEKWVADFQSIDEIVDLLVKAGVPVARVNTIPDVVRDPQIRARQLIVERSHPTLGPMELQNPLGPNFPDTATSGHPPFLGENNEELVVGLAGFSRADYERFTESGVLYRDPRADAASRGRKSGT